MTFQVYLIRKNDGNNSATLNEGLSRLQDSTESLTIDFSNTPLFEEYIETTINGFR